MEVIPIPVTPKNENRVEYAKRYLLPKQIKLAGLKECEIQVTDGAVNGCYSLLHEELVSWIRARSLEKFAVGSR